MLIPTKFLLTLYNPRLELDFIFFATLLLPNKRKTLVSRLTSVSVYPDPVQVIEIIGK